MAGCWALDGSDGIAGLLGCGFADRGFADLLDRGFADWWVVGRIIPNFLLLVAFRKFILFGSQGEVNVG